MKRRDFLISLTSIPIVASLLNSSTVKPYNKLVFKEYEDNNGFSKGCNLKDNFAIYLQNHPNALKAPYTFIESNVGVVNKHTMQIQPYNYSKDSINEIAFLAKTIRVSEPDGTHISIRKEDLENLDAIFEKTVHFLNNRQPFTHEQTGTTKHFYFSDILWSHLCDYTNFSPLPSVLVRFYELKG